MRKKKLRVVVSNHQRRSGRQQSRLKCGFLDTPLAYRANTYLAADSWKTCEYETQSFLVTQATRARITVCARYGGLGGALYTVIHLLIHLSDSSVLFSPIRVGRPVRTMNLCVRDAPPRTLWKTPRLAYVRPCNLSTSLRPTIVTRTCRPPRRWRLKNKTCTSVISTMNVFPVCCRLHLSSTCSGPRGHPGLPVDALTVH